MSQFQAIHRSDQNADQVQFMIGVLLACITIGVANILWSVTARIIRYYKVSLTREIEHDGVSF